jgi:hypothetical protein
MSENFSHLGGLNAYEILGVEQTATTTEIEAAYRAAIKRQHSDTGGVNRLAQLINDARDVLVKRRASYDAWLRDPARQRVADGASDTGDADNASAEDVWDPWEAYDSPTPPPPQYEEPPKRPKPPPPPPPKRASQAETQPESPSDTTSPYPTSLFPEESREGGADESAISDWWAVLASVLCGPLGLWLGVRSHRRRRSPVAATAIVIGSMNVLLLVSVAIAIPLGVFKEPSTTSSPATPPVVKQGQVVAKPGTRIVLDEEGTSLTPATNHASLVGTQSGLAPQAGTSYVALAQSAPERYDACSSLTYPEGTGKPIPWSRLTVGSMLCARTTASHPTKSLITVVDRSGRSATLKIITWKD